MSSNRRSVSRRESPRMEAFRYTFSRPVSSGWKPAARARSAAIRPRVITLPLLGRRMPAMILRSVVLPDPFGPISPSVLPSGTSNETSWSAQRSSARRRKRTTRSLRDVGRSRYRRNRLLTPSTATAATPKVLVAMRVRESTGEDETWPARARGSLMRVAVDARPAAFPEKTGIGYYTWNLLRHLPRVDPSTRYLAWYLNARAILGGPRRLLGDLPGVRERWTPIPARWFERTERLGLPRLEWFVGFDVLFGPNFIPPPSHARHQVVTVHDLAFRLYPETAPHTTLVWLASIERALRRSTRIIAVSEATRRDLLDLYPVPPDRVAVVPHGVDHDVRS